MHKKVHINLAVIGHVDSGKSTLVGHLMVKLGSVDKRAIDINEKAAAEVNKRTSKYAWVLDKLKTEREQGHTIDFAVAKFETPKYHFTVTDAPGHRDYVKNMISGTCYADAALLVVDATAGAFESGISKDGQTREHAQLAYTLGIRQLVVAVNKMDAHDYHASRFDEIKTQTTAFLKKVGFNTDKISFVPISGWAGDNLKDKSNNMPWYTGPTLVEVLDEIEPPKRLLDKPLRLPVQDVFKLPGAGLVVCGRIESGMLRTGMSVTFVPSGHTTDVTSIEFHGEKLTEASPGDNVGFQIKAAPPKPLERGAVCCDASNAAATEVSSFQAQVFITHPGEVHAGYTPMLDIHTSHVACKFQTLISKLDRKTGKETEKDPKVLKNGDVAIVELVPTKPLVVESFADFPALGRFALRDNRQVVGLGVVKSVVHKQPVTKAAQQRAAKK